MSLNSKLRSISSRLQLLAYCAVFAFVAGFGFVLGLQVAQRCGLTPPVQRTGRDTPFQMHTCYYAHPMSIYGTKQESEDIQLLETLGFAVINPNVPEYKTRDMAYFCNLAAKADVVAFRSQSDGKISPGVALELQKAKHVIELPNANSLDARSLSGT